MRVEAKAMGYGIFMLVLSILRAGLRLDFLFYGEIAAVWEGLNPHCTVSASFSVKFVLDDYPAPKKSSLRWNQTYLHVKFS